MKKTLCSAWLLGAAISTQPAMADISAAELLAEWKEDAAFMEMEMTLGSEVMEGDTLTLNDLTFRMEIPEGSIEVHYDWMTISEVGDGSLELLFSPSVAVQTHTDDGHDGVVDISVAIEFGDAVALITGTQKDHIYDFSASEMAIKYSFDTVAIPGDLTAAIELFDFTAQAHQVTTVWEDAFVEISTNAEHALTQLIYAYPDEGIQIDFNADIAGVSTEMRQDISPHMDFSAKAAHGDSTSSVLNWGQAVFNVKGTTPDFDISFDGGANSTQLGSNLEDNSFEISGARTGFFLNLQLPEFGIPNGRVAMDDMAFNVILPVDHSGAVSDVAAKYESTGLSVDEAFWAIIDPEQVISRDPFAIVVDLSAKVKMFRDIFDPEFDEFSDETIGEIVSLTVNELSADIAGVVFSSVAAFKFNNDDMTSFDGFPQPIGKLSFDLKGAFGLIGNLITAGILPPMEALGIKAGIGTIAVAADGEDHFVSEIEFTEDAHILVNGAEFK